MTGNPRTLSPSEGTQSYVGDTRPQRAGPRGSVNEPGDGALFCWDGLHALDNEWTGTGALEAITDMGSGGGRCRSGRPPEGGSAPQGRSTARPISASATSSARLLTGSTSWCAGLARSITATHQRWKSCMLQRRELLHDLVNDPGELENLGHPDHPNHDPGLVERMLAKLHRLVEQELGEDRRPFDMDLFGTHDMKYRQV